MGSKAITLKDSKGNKVYPSPYYPIGSIYMSVNSTNPADFFGGTWEQIKGRFLLACDSFYTAGSTGGEKAVTLFRNHLPSHSHKVNVTKSTGGDNGGSYGIQMRYSNSYTGADIGECTTSHNYNGIVLSGGGDQPHNNMPPYLAVYMWKRVS